MHFVAGADNHKIDMDTKSPFGNDSALSPKQLVLAAICGCAGMDAISLLKKYNQPTEAFHIEADATLSENGHPIIFKKVHLIFKLKGPLDTIKIKEAIHLTLTQYCSVSAMISKSAPISYTIDLNGETVGDGQAHFN